MQGRIPDIFLGFEFQRDQLKNVGAVGGRIFAFPIDLAHRLYNSLLLSHKPWSYLWNKSSASFNGPNIPEMKGLGEQNV